jgi:hypothetical protein
MLDDWGLGDGRISNMKLVGMCVDVGKTGARR